MLGARAPEVTAYDVLLGKANLRAAIVAVSDRLDILPSAIDLAGAEVELLNEVGGQVRLRTRLERAGRLPYDFVIIDCPPSLGLLTINALAAASEILVTVAPGVFSLKGLAQLQATIEKVRANLAAPRLKISGVLLCLADRTKVSSDVHAALVEKFGRSVFKTTIPKNVALEESHSRAQSVFDYAPASTGAEAYGELVKEVLRYGEK
jgi:chromosome partitioning protein